MTISNELLDELLKGCRRPVADAHRQRHEGGRPALDTASSFTRRP
jgi:hypothetical protein